MSKGLEDVSVTAPIAEEHLKGLQIILQRFQDAGLKLKKSKCVCFTKRVTYLGQVIDKHGLHKPSQKVKVINKAPGPSNATEL